MKHDHQAVAAMAVLEAEHSLIGALLLDNGAWDRIGDTVKTEHFYSDRNRTFFAEISRQIVAGKQCDVVTTGTALKDPKAFAELNALAQYVPSAANVRRYAALIVERYQSRQLMAVSSAVTELAQDHERSIEERIEDAQGQLVKLIGEAPRDEWIGAAEGMALHTSLLEDRASGKTTAMATGLADLDEYLEGGIRPGELVIIGARPSQGKTALAMTIGINMAERYAVAMLSMEMPHTEVRDRLTAMIGGVSLSAVKRPNLGAGLQWDRVVDGVDRARNLNFAVSDQGGLNINQVRAKARNVKRLRGLKVLIVDYIGLMSGLDGKQSRAYQLEEISRGLKTLAKELDIAVVCLAQVNRKVEERVDQTAGLSDLRDSGAIEQDADIILFINRPIQAKPDLGPEWQYYAKVSVAKNRQGRCGVLSLSYIGDQTRFDGWEGPAPTRNARAKGGDL